MLERSPFSRLVHWLRRDSTSTLVAVLAQQPDDSAALRQALDRAETEYARRPSYRLALVLGEAWELRASQHLAWEERGEAFARALCRFEEAIALAQRLSVAEAVTIARQLPAEAACFPEERRALLFAQARAGALLAAEFRVRDPARAVSYLEAVIDAAQDFHPAFYYLGEAYMLQRQFDDAERAWRRGLALAPDNATIRTVLANLPQDRATHAKRHGDWAGVIAALTSPDGRAIRSVEMLRLLGDAYFALGHYDQAEGAWRDALTVSAKAGGIRGRLNKLQRARQRLVQ